MMSRMFLAGGVAVAAVALVAKLAYQKFFNHPQSLDKQTVVQKLINMRQFLYPILFEIADIVQTKLIPKGIPPDQAKIFIMENQSLAFKQNIESLLSQKVYFDVDESTLEYAIEHSFKDDKQVQFYKRAFQQEYDKCFLGIKPQNLTTKMLLISKDTLFRIVATLLETKIMKLKQIILDCQEQVSKFTGQISVDKKHEIFTDKLSLELSKDENEDDSLRVKILKEFKINDVKSFEFAIAKFIDESADFKQKYEQLQQIFKKNANQIITSQMNFS